MHGADRLVNAGQAVGQVLLAVLLRQPATRGDLYLVFDGGPYGRSRQHEDMLGFWLFAFGRSFIVDPGRHLYDNSEKSFYQHLCSTRAHSTFRIDDCDQHARGRRDTWIATEPVPLSFTQRDGEIRAAAQYDLGYGQSNDVHVVHRREVVFVRERCWVLFDTILGQGEHTCESRFQFAPHAALSVQGPRVTTQCDDANLLLWSAPATPWQRVAVEEGQTNPRSGWYSHRYGLLEPAPCLVSTTTTTLPFTVATLLWPSKGNMTADVSFTFDGVQATIRSGSDSWLIAMSS